MNTDARLIEAYKQIDAGKVALLSVDIFDTLLWRKVPEPNDVFLLLGRKLKSEGWLIEAVPPEIFPELRLNAVRLAKAIKNKQTGIENPEVTLQEIYWSLHGIFPQITTEQMIAGKKGILNESDIDELVAIEVSLEKQLTQYDLNIVRLVQYASERKIPVILVSDTYLDQTHLSNILNKNFSILPFIQKIYTSCEYGIRKINGLFKVIVNEMKVNQNKIHIGDNPFSDSSSSDEGFSFVYYDKYTGDMHHIFPDNIIQREWPQNDVSQRNSMLDPEYGDFGLTAMRSKTLYSTSIQAKTRNDAFFLNYGGSVLGPILLGFTKWIYERSQELGFSQAFCLMREGKLYADLIKEFAPHSKHALEPKELWISRNFIIPAAIAYATESELMSASFAFLRTAHTVESFCHALGLEVEECGLTPYRHVKMNEEEMRKHVAVCLSEDEYIRDKIRLNALIKRKCFLKYLSKMVDLSKTNKMLLVDVGWGGSLQGALQAILNMEGYHINVHGLYLGTERGTDIALLRGYTREGYLLKNGFPKGAATIIRKGFFALEQTATIDIPPLKDFDEKGNLILGKSVIPKKQVNQAKLVQDGIQCFFKQYGEYLQNEMTELNPSSKHLEEQLRQIFLRSVSLLTRSEVEHFSQWQHDFASGRMTQHDECPIGNDPYYEKYIGDMVPEAVYKDLNVIWPAAYLSRFDRTSALTARAAGMQILPNECFLSHDTLPLKVLVDYGRGFKSIFRKIDLRSNVNRHFYAFDIFNSFHKPIKGIRFEIECPQSLIRINSLRMITWNKANPESEIFIYFESEDEKSSLEYTATKKIEHNTFYCDESSQLVLTHIFECTKVYSVQLNLCCETFRGLILPLRH